MLMWFAHRVKEARDDEQGFTLIELLVVVIIIGILAAIAIPTFLSQRDKANDADAKSAARNAATAVKSISTECNGKYVAPPNCTAALTFANAADAAIGGDASLAKYSAAPYNGTVATQNNNSSFTVTVTSKADSNQNAVFDSATGEVTMKAKTP